MACETSPCLISALDLEKGEAQGEDCRGEYCSAGVVLQRTQPLSVLHAGDTLAAILVMSRTGYLSVNQPPFPEP